MTVGFMCHCLPPPCTDSLGCSLHRSRRHTEDDAAPPHRLSYGAHARISPGLARACQMCQCNKLELQLVGLLQPLEVSSHVWLYISMDFIEGLMRVSGKSVDCFSKYAHFILLAHRYMASSVAHVFLDDIVHLHGFPSSIVSDRDPIFNSNFWTEFSSLSGLT